MPDFTYMSYLRVGKLLEAEDGMTVARGWERADGESMLRDTSGVRMSES